MSARPRGSWPLAAPGLELRGQALAPYGAGLWIVVEHLAAAAALAPDARQRVAFGH